MRMGCKAGSAHAVLLTIVLVCQVPVTRAAALIGRGRKRLPTVSGSPHLSFLKRNSTTSSSLRSSDGALDVQSQSTTDQVINAYSPVWMSWFRGKDWYMFTTDSIYFPSACRYMFTTDSTASSAEMEKLKDLREDYLCEVVFWEGKARKEEEGPDGKQLSCLFQMVDSKLKADAVQLDKTVRHLGGDPSRFRCTAKALGSTTLLSDLDFRVECQERDMDHGDFVQRRSTDAFIMEANLAEFLTRRAEKSILHRVGKKDEHSRKKICEVSQ
uniref:Uncharacterized protein n=1 Tax=Chromera velia CCMP2878 TaxID=1169474 RepID=A0A0K6S620_9ALVE|eukprot:Cvel_15837.t2-p1 / transcript=Cvel_15837.t2 / gene=Cvel_15837 / organism=Chromera_velia_CCMP2878 / gene_product=hypothetical protein / transcript_product=hypothetical protein / location=Cvel_scaffold1190:35768-37744(+) / protein_length=269 / sequence_SO=supercontig / SO=protein_coding / is_pseudo=false